MYVCMQHICCRVSIWSNICLLSQCLVQFLLLLFYYFVKVPLLSAGKSEFEKANKTCVLNWPNSWDDFRSNYVRQHSWTRCWPKLGLDIDSTFWTSVGLLLLFWFVAETTVLIVVSGKKAFLSPPQKTFGTSESGFVFMHFCLLGFLPCPFSSWVVSCQEGKPPKQKVINNKVTNKKAPDDKIQTSKQSSLVFLRQKTTHT